MSRPVAQVGTFRPFRPAPHTPRTALLIRELSSATYLNWPQTFPDTTDFHSRRQQERLP